jgi:hypothetical protein
MMAEVIPMPVNVATLPSEQKIEFLAKQIAEVKAGARSSIFCPYCGTRNRPSDEFLCCALFGEATAAILDRTDKTDAIEFMQKAHDNAMRRVN